ncbi:MAG: hypothetical protein QOJ50_2668 [Cryptosporangiaceae bacterium]|nr:hypothetical protein [Cryptosporangiaceae bacterium]
MGHVGIGSPHRARFIRAHRSNMAAFAPSSPVRASARNSCGDRAERLYVGQVLLQAADHVSGGNAGGPVTAPQHPLGRGGHTTAAIVEGPGPVECAVAVSGL